MPTTLRLSKDSDNVVTLTLDAPGKSVNTCSPAFFADLAEALDQIERDKPAAILFASAKPRSFNAGADLFEIRDMSPEQVRAFIALGQQLFDRIATLAMPTVAAINGDCLGGGFEMALACRYRVAADDGSISIGLPEVKLGLIPAWGGTTRLPRIIGLPRALSVLLPGKVMPPKKALKTGLVEEVVRPEALLAAARRVALSKRAATHPSLGQRAGAWLSPMRSRILAAARRKTARTTFDNYPAPMKLLDVVDVGYRRGMPAGLEAERGALAELMESDACRNLMRIFFLKQAAKKRAAEQAGGTAAPIRHAAVIGGGTMGAGIVHALIRAGVPVRLIEVDDNAISAALARISRMLNDDVAAGKIDKITARHTLNRVAPSTEWTGLQLADIVIEAVLETIDVKRQVFAKLQQFTRPDAVLATNTSSLRVSEIAQALDKPGRIVGLHFFNPVPRMPLVEVVQAPQSDPRALATAVALAARIGKTPVLVKDSPGFLVNRVLIPYLAEALSAATEGIAIPVIDAAMKRWGMPMGPFELLDEIGLDVAAHVFRSLDGQFLQNWTTLGAIQTAIDRGWLGTKTGKGFYIHSGERASDREARLNDALAAIVTAHPPPAPATQDPAELARLQQEIQWRLVLPMVKEAGRVLHEGIVDSVDAIDLATVLGTGLAPFRGGLAQFARSTGLEELTRQMAEMAGKHGERFAPAEGLETLVSGNASNRVTTSPPPVDAQAPPGVTVGRDPTDRTSPEPPPQQRPGEATFPPAGNTGGRESQGLPERPHAPSGNGTPADHPEPHPTR